MAKKSNNDLLKIAGIAAILYFISQKVGGLISDQFYVTKAKFRVTGFNPSNLTLSGQVILSFANTTPAPIPFNSFFGTVNYGPVLLSNVETFVGGSFPANSVTDVPISTKINLFKLGEDAISLYKSGQLLNALTLSGMAHLGKGIKVPVNKYKLI